MDLDYSGLVFFADLGTAEVLFFFFFSSRRRHTRSLCDWSSDVCSSDLLASGDMGRGIDGHHQRRATPKMKLTSGLVGAKAKGPIGWLIWDNPSKLNALRSEERRVGKECRSRWSPYH